MGNLIKRKMVSKSVLHVIVSLQESLPTNVQATSDMFETHHVSQNDVDSEEEEDYYFSDAD